MRIRQNVVYNVINSEGKGNSYSLMAQYKDVVVFRSVEDLTKTITGNEYDKEEWTFVGVDGEKYSIKKPEKPGKSRNIIRSAEAFTGEQTKAIDAMIKIAGDKTIKYNVEIDGKEWVINIHPYTPREKKDLKPIKKAPYRTTAEKLAAMKKK